MQTPMGPFLGVMQNMSHRDMQIVVSFFQEEMKKKETKVSSDDDKAAIIREKYKNLKVPASLRKLRGCLKLTEEELEDDRTQYILAR